MVDYTEVRETMEAQVKKMSERDLIHELYLSGSELRERVETEGKIEATGMARILFHAMFVGVASAELKSRGEPDCDKNCADCLACYEKEAARQARMEEDLADEREEEWDKYCARTPQPGQRC